MASEVEICNMALYEVGCERITSLSDDSKQAIICNDLYTHVRDQLLRSHPWNFTILRVALAVTASTPSYGYTYEYTIPADCMRIIGTEYDNYEGFEYSIENGKLYTDEGSIKIEYISKITDTSKFDANFTEALVYKLAAKLAYPLVQSNELKSTLEAKAEMVLRDARLFDGQEGSPRQFKRTRWTDVRL